MPDVSVVIPVYNERNNLTELHIQITAALRDHDYELIFVDDGSGDGSAECLRALVDSDLHMAAILFRRNFGQTAALAAGIAEARGRLIVTLDADLQNDPSDIPAMLEKMETEGYDILSGWRKNRHDGFIARQLPSILANRLIAWAAGVPLHDSGCTLKIYRAEVIKGIALYGEMHRLIPVYGAWVGAKIGETAVRHHPRRHGKSKYGSWSRTYKVLLDLLTALFLGGYGTKPIYFFGSLATISCILGVISGAVVLYHKFVFGYYAHRNPLLLLAIFLFLIGVQSLTFGLLAEINIRTYHESQGKPIYFIREIVRGERESAR